MKVLCFRHLLSGCFVIFIANKTAWSEEEKLPRRQNGKILQRTMVLCVSTISLYCRGRSSLLVGGGLVDTLAEAQESVINDKVQSK